MERDIQIPGCGPEDERHYHGLGSVRMMYTLAGCDGTLQVNGLCLKEQVRLCVVYQGNPGGFLAKGGRGIGC